MNTYLGMVEHVSRRQYWRQCLGQYGSPTRLREAIEYEDPYDFVLQIQEHLEKEIQLNILEAKKALKLAPLAKGNILSEASRDIGRLAYALYLVSHPYSVERGLTRFLHYLETHTSTQRK